MTICLGTQFPRVAAQAMLLWSARQHSNLRPPACETVANPPGDATSVSRRFAASCRLPTAYRSYFHLIEKKILDRAAQHVRSRYNVETTGALEQPKQSSFGELAIPVAFHLARQLKQTPKAAT